VNINIRHFGVEYLKQTNCYEDSIMNFKIAKFVASCFPFGNVLDLGCGRGWLVKALKSFGLSATGIDISQEILNESVISANCYLHSATNFSRMGNFRYETVILNNLLQCLELPEILELINQLEIVGCKRVLIFDEVYQPQTAFALGREEEFYIQVFKSMNWEISRSQAISQTIVDSKFLIFEDSKNVFKEDLEEDFCDPWLIHHDNTAVCVCVLYENEVELGEKKLITKK
jgi:hypothetical protein